MNQPRKKMRVFCYHAYKRAVLRYLPVATWAFSKPSQLRYLALTCCEYLILPEARFAGFLNYTSYTLWLYLLECAQLQTPCNLPPFKRSLLALKAQTTTCATSRKGLTHSQPEFPNGKS